ncbi:hypothetical protein OSH11_13240 [Kaistia dalseonensis]|uniref:Uncharacterized protein n=1 Tax=Kaistia dalseonensis TaxID=410840 RepID=A0ABU0H8S8_9HYPH|nr:hypothetical protein [Kaistia dalseonensis]MCX5495674.1 hypothetical protein [Kaistia dalseonensis]MDQ0438268.1 hypothetical protein [Kaistia dalseonensis]
MAFELVLARRRFVAALTRRLVLIAPASVVLGVFIITMLGLAGRATDPVDLLAVISGVAVIIWTGIVTLVVAPTPFEERLFAGMVIGVAVTGLALVFGVFVLNLSPGAAFLLWLIFAIPAGMWIELSSDKIDHSVLLDFNNIADVAIIVSVCVIVGYLCVDYANSTHMFAETGRYPLWGDYFIHGTTIAEFSSPMMLGRGNPILSDQHISVYHYAPFLLIGVIAQAFDLPGLVAATALLLPIGLVLALVAAFALASELGGRSAGLLAIAAFCLIPDAGSYGLRNSFFSFDWLTLIVPGAGYGMAIASIFVLLVTRHLRYGDSTLWLCLVLLVALFNFRFHGLLIVVPAAALTWLSRFPFVRRNWGWFASIVIAGIGAFLVFGLIAPDRVLVFDHLFSVGPFLRDAHGVFGVPTAYDGFYASVVSSLGPILGGSVGIILLLPAILGAFCLVLPIALVMRMKGAKERGGWPPIVELFPFYVIVSYIAVVLVSPMAANGDSSEYSHRSFPFVYYFVAIFTSSFLGGWLFKARLERSRILVLAPLVMAAVFVAAMRISQFDPSKPKVSWAKFNYDVPVDPNTVSVAAVLKKNARPGDTFAVSPVDPNALFVDLGTVIASLSNVPTYVGSPAALMGEGAERQHVVFARLGQLKAIEGFRDAPSVAAALHAIGLDWYVVLTKGVPSFDPDTRFAAYKTPGAYIYRISPLGAFTGVEL